MLVELSENGFYEWVVKKRENEAPAAQKTRIPNCEGEGLKFVECCLKSLNSKRCIRISKVDRSFFVGDIVEHI